MCQQNFFDLFNTFNNWSNYFILPNQNLGNNCFNYSKKIKTGKAFLFFIKKLKTRTIEFD